MSERERPQGTVSCPACGGAAVVCDGAGESPCDECGCTGSVDAVAEVKRLRGLAEMQSAALRAVALWLGGPAHSPQPAEVEALARAKAEELDAARVVASEHGALRRVLHHAVILHPLPWRVDQDWTWEVIADDGAIVVKCMTLAEAQAVVSLATEMAADMAAEEGDGHGYDANTGVTHGRAE